MICRQCKTENNDSAKFCRACGAKLEQSQMRTQGTLCPACGAKNSLQSAFCKECGAQLKTQGFSRPVQQQNDIYTGYTATVGDSSNTNKVKDAMGGVIGKMPVLFKNTFTEPTGMIRRGRREQDYWKVTLFVALIGNLLIAAIFPLKLSSVAGDYGVASDYVEDQLGFSPMGLFFKLWMLLILTSAIVVALMFAASKIFGSECSMFEMAGASGPVMLLSAISVFLSEILIISQSEGLIYISMILLGVCSVWEMILLWITFKETAELDDTRSIYAFLTGIVLTAIGVYLLVYLFGQAMFAGVSSMIGFGS